MSRCLWAGGAGKRSQWSCSTQPLATTGTSTGLAASDDSDPDRSAPPLPHANRQLESAHVPALDPAPVGPNHDSLLLAQEVSHPVCIWMHWTVTGAASQLWK